MKNNMVFEKAKKDIFKILNSFIIARETGTHQEYKTLTDTLSIMSCLYLKEGYGSVEDVQAKSVDIISRLECEMKEIDVITEQLLEKKELKAYRDWLISYEKIASVREKFIISHSFVLKQSSLPQYKK